MPSLSQSIYLFNFVMSMCVSECVHVGNCQIEFYAIYFFLSPFNFIVYSSDTLTSVNICPSSASIDLVLNILYMFFEICTKIIINFIGLYASVHILQHVCPEFLI